MDLSGPFILIALTVFGKTSGVGRIWSEWWTYSGISGPRYWGVHNSEWSICNRGKYQSPIDIDPQHLVYDPYLSDLHITDSTVDGSFRNNGHDLSLTINATRENKMFINSGPLSYTYTLYEIKLHFGTNDNKGSEHSIGGKSFPLEIQFYGYNGETNKNLSRALHTPHGIVALVILAQVSYEDNLNLDTIITSATEVKVKGMSVPVNNLNLRHLLPSTQTYITYEGSITQPGCMETVTWVILNRPVHVSHKQLQSLRSLTNHDGSGQYLMENNFRTTMPINDRLIRTNIKPTSKTKDCYSFKKTSYQVNNKLKTDTSTGHL